MTRSTPTGLDYDAAYRACFPGTYDTVRIQDLQDRSLATVARVAQLIARTRCDARVQALREARQIVEMETDSYPGASPAITSGIYGGFDQWAAGQIEECK
jgi:hypothetical protein